MVQADVLLALAAKHRTSEASHLRLLKEIVVVLESAAVQFEAVAELNPLRRCHYLLSRTYHQLGNLPRRNACATRFRQISEFFDSSARGKSGSWEALGLTPEKKSAHCSFEDQLKSHADLPSSLPSFMPSTPPSCSASSPMAQGRVSARPGNTLSGSIAGSAIMGAFGEVSPFTYAFDAAEAAAAAAAALARIGQAGDSQDQDAQDQLNVRCPALAQLLAVAEAASIGDDEEGGANASAKGIVQGGQAGSTCRAALSSSGPATSGRGGGVQTVVGTIHSLYPMAAVLGT